MIHRYTNPVRGELGKRDLYITICGLTVERYQCVASDFKTTCEACVKEIIKRREAELALIKAKLKPDDWKFKDLQK